MQCLLLLVYHGRGATEAGSRGVLRVTFPGDHDGDGEGDSDMTVIVEDEVQLEAEAGDSEDLAARAPAPVSGRRLDEGQDEVIRVKRQFTTKIDARTGKPVKTGCKIEGYQTKEREVCEEIVERICEVTTSWRRIGRSPTRPSHEPRHKSMTLQTDNHSDNGPPTAAGACIRPATARGPWLHVTRSN